MSDNKNKHELIRRFHIISGQIEGITKMIDDDKDCNQIMNQMKAVKSGFNRLSEEFIKTYLHKCVKANKNEDFNKALSLLSTY